MFFFFLVTGYSSRGFRNIRVELLGRFRGAHLKVTHLPMLTLACVVHAHWCFHGNNLKLAPLPHITEQRGTAESSISQSKHTDRKTHESNYSKTIMHVSQVYPHTYIHATLHKKQIYILCIKHK